MSDANEKQSVFKDAIKNNLGPVLKYLDDKTVSEILVNGHKEIFIERAFRRGRARRGRGGRRGAGHWGLTRDRTRRTRDG